jgi:hypothetical protein
MPAMITMRNAEIKRIMIETYSVVVAQSELNVVYDSLNEFKEPTGNLMDRFYLFEIPVYSH